MSADPQQPVSARMPADALPVLLLIILLESLLANVLTYTSLLPGAYQQFFIGIDPVSCLLVILALIFWRTKPGWTYNVLLLYTAYVTFSLAVSATLLVVTLPQRQGPEGGVMLLYDGLIIWVINVFVFAIWYWLIDGGGPIRRGLLSAVRSDFRFPLQMNDVAGWENWQPRFVDYLYMAFNTGTSFSPSDVLVLSPRAKLMVGLQALISMATVLMVLARAVNIIA